MRKDATPEPVRQEIVRLYLEGMGGPELAKRYRCTVTSVYKFVRAAGHSPKQIAHDRGTGGKGTRRFTDAEEREIARLYDAGWSFPRLEQRFGVGHKTLARAMKRQGQASRSRHVRPVLPEQREAVVAAFKETGSVREVSERERLGPPRVRAILQQAGLAVPTRPARERHWRWKGGRLPTSSGYVRVLLPREHPFYTAMADAQGYVMEHRLVMAEALGRPLTPWETVHHIDGDRSHNEKENLQLRSGRHGNGVVHRCRACGSFDIETVQLT